jgi:hypothetical protein
MDTSPPGRLEHESTKPRGVTILREAIAAQLGIGVASVYRVLRPAKGVLRRPLRANDAADRRPQSNSIDLSTIDSRRL